MHATSGIKTAARQIIQRSARMMGTKVSIQLSVDAAEADDAVASAEDCLTWLAEVDARLSRFRPESELCHLNRAAGRWFSASPLLFAAVARALDGARESDGLFDPTLLPQLEALGYDRDFAQIAHREIIEDVAHETVPSRHHSASAAGGWRAIELDLRAQRIRMPPGVRLDLGGIAKGWAADIALERFCAGYPGTLVNVGGDLRARGGPQPGESWAIGIRDPRAEAAEWAGPGSFIPTHIATITLSRGGLATSGALRRWWLHGGVRQHHLLDPRTGLPARLWTGEQDGIAAPDAHVGVCGPLAAVTALAPTAAQAEVATKVALLTGYPHALDPASIESLGRQGGDSRMMPSHAVALLLTFATGEVRMSANIGGYLATWGTEGASIPYTIPPATIAQGQAHDQTERSKPQI
jgi:thiamine biosynthesis lipoprotein